MKFFPVALMLLSSVATAQTRQLSPGDLLKLKVSDADHRISYGKDLLNFGELRLPAGQGPFPVAILVHGGCWLDHLPKNDPRTTTYELLRPLAAALTARGIATWNIEYRRAGSPGGSWPAPFLDLAAATDFVRTLAPTYNLDLRRVIVVGHSSGGQLALWIAARPKVPTASAVYTRDPLVLKAAIDVDGPPDLAAAQPYVHTFCPADGIQQLMGGTPAEQPQRYRDSSAQTFLPLGVPQEIVTAGLLQNAGRLLSSYEAAVKAKGETVTEIKVEGSGHFTLMAPDTPYGKMLVDAITQVLSTK